MFASAAWMLVIVFICVSGLWLLAVMVLQRVSRQDDDEPGADPFRTLSRLFDEGEVRAGEDEVTRSNPHSQAPTPS